MVVAIAEKVRRGIAQGTCSLLARSTGRSDDQRGAPQNGAWDLMWRMAALGAANGLCNPAIMAAVLEGAPERKGGTDGGLASTARAIGQVLGPGVCAYIWSAAGACTAAFAATVVTTAVLVGVGALLVAATGADGHHSQPVERGLERAAACKAPRRSPTAHHSRPPES
jgi:MFS family permease